MAQKKDNAKEPTWRDVYRSDPDGLRALIHQTLQEVLEGEMDEAVGAQKSERTAERLGYRSGYYTRTLVTRVGKLVLRVPQDRKGRFRTEVFERYQRSEKALVSALTEMYIQGVSTRKVKAITEELCGHEFSGATISRVTETQRNDSNERENSRKPIKLAQMIHVNRIKILCPKHTAIRPAQCGRAAGIGGDERDTTGENERRPAEAIQVVCPSLPRGVSDAETAALVCKTSRYDDNQ